MSHAFASKIGYRPLKLKKYSWVWQSAFVDAFAYHYVLSGPIFDKLTGYYEHDGSTLYKHYANYESAMKAYQRAIGNTPDTNLS